MSLCYYNPYLFKTDATPEVLYDIFKKYKIDNYPKENLFKNMTDDSYKSKILKKDIKHNPTFFEFEGNLHQGKFLSNPTKNWGPKAKAKLVKYANNLINKIIK